MINKLLQILAPHYCYGCGKVGMVLCQNCKYDIIEHSFDLCIVCGLLTGVGVCDTCKTSYDRAWCIGERSDVLLQLINAHKFERNQDIAASFASLFDAILPVFPTNTVIVHIPSLPSHIRVRGYDHVFDIARELAKLRGIEHISYLQRIGKYSQRDKNKRVRFMQASESFGCDISLDPALTYLVIDDVVTTNATLHHAASALRRVGAETVWVAVVARQPMLK